MFNPGLIYILASLVLYLVKGQSRKILAILTSLAVLVSIYFLPETTGLRINFLDFELILYQVDGMRKFVGFIFAFFALAAVIYSLVNESNKFYPLTALYVGAAIALVFVGDFFSFYILWELMTISSFFLIYQHNNQLLRKTGYYYFIMHLAGGVSLLLGILLQYNATGSIAITTVEYGLPFFVIAIAVKLAFIGFHTWLPQNYANVSLYISVVLSGFTTKVGVFAMYLLLGNVALGYAGVASAIIGVFMALQQTKVRKLLSYHIVSQVGFMIAGIGVGTSLGAVGGMMHMFNNILYKGLLFMVIGVVIYTTGEEDLINLGGLAKKIPFTTFCGVVASLAIAGMPFFNGHISKMAIKSGLNNPILEWGLFIAGIGTSLSFLKVMYFGFFRERDTKLIRQPTVGMKFAMGLVVALNLVLGIVPQVYNLLGNFGYGFNYLSLSYIWAGLQPLLMAGVIFKVAHDLIEPHEHDHTERDIYLVFAGIFDIVGVLISRVQNGDLSRYILWTLGSLALLWTYFLTI